MSIMRVATGAVTVVLRLPEIIEREPRAAAVIDDLIDVLEDSSTEWIAASGRALRAWLQIPDDIGGDPD